MKVRLVLWWDVIRSAYWFIPILMLLLSAGLAVTLITLDERVEMEDLRGAWWIFSGGAEGARSLLSTVAGSAIGVAGTTFSITVAVLSLTSSQFGSRLLRGFLRDRSNQFVLGTFVSTFLYCLLVLRTIRSIEEVSFVPHIAVTGGVLLAILCIAVLIYFIHHVSSSIQASSIITNVADEIQEAMNRLYPEEIGDDSDASQPLPFTLSFETPSGIVRADANGYLQAIDGDALLAIAEKANVFLRLEQKPGLFITDRCPLATVYSTEPVDSETVKKIRAVFTIGRMRTAAQDLEFLLLQLVEIAVRALSPSVNDPYTVLTCLDYIGASLCDLTRRRIPTRAREDSSGIVRIFAERDTFKDWIETAFAEIYRYGKSDPLVMAKLQEVLQKIDTCCRTKEQSSAIRHAIARFSSHE